jgi:hypothetical protein
MTCELTPEQFVQYQAGMRCISLVHASAFAAAVIASAALAVTWDRKWASIRPKDRMMRGVRIAAVWASLFVVVFPVTWMTGFSLYQSPECPIMMMADADEDPILDPKCWWATPPRPS